MIKTAVILAGGKGERMMPLTELQPKALVPIHGVPILKLQIEEIKVFEFLNTYSFDEFLHILYSTTD